MKILMLCMYDWANTGWRYSQCLKMLGHEVLFYKSTRHAFDYPEQGEIHPLLEKAGRISVFPIAFKAHGLRPIAEEADIIWFIGTQFIDTGIDLTKKRVIANYSGATCITEIERTNNLFAPFVDSTVLQFASLSQCHAKNAKLIYYPVDTYKLKPESYDIGDKIIIGHFPSSSVAKGTKHILKIIDKLPKDKFEYVGVTPVDDEMAPNVSWIEQLKRVQQCDILIESLYPRIWKMDDIGGYLCQQPPDKTLEDGVVVADLGNTVFEASAFGKIVVTDFAFSDVYKKEYTDQLPVFIANDVTALEETLNYLLSCEKSKLVELKKEARFWAEKYHSMEATAIRMENKVIYDN